MNPEQFHKYWKLPTADQWTDNEYPQLEQAYINHRGHSPSATWAAFQTYRRLAEPHIWTFAKMLAWETNGGQIPPVDPPTNPNLPVAQSLKVDGPVFRKADNSIFRMKGFTFFKGVNLFESGVNLDSLLDEYAGYNSPRIFLYTPERDWKQDYWRLPSKEVTLEFIKYCNSRGLYPEITLATDDDQSKIEPIKEIIRYLEDKDIVLLYEAVNEPNVGGKLSPDIFKNILSGSKFLYSSGIYYDNKLFWGKFWNDHSARDSEWYRKGGKSLYEAFKGGGPSFPDEPALRCACVEDEPIRPDQCGYDSLSYYQYAASCGMMGAGARFHCSSGKYSRNLSAGEQSCKDAFLAGLNVFPLEAPLSINHYDRIVEPGNEPGGNNTSARTYVLGNHSVRIHQKGLSHPRGWKPLDDLGVAFIKP